MSQLQEAIDWIRVHPPQRITVLTGSGISAESGIPTFRGKEGLWRNFRAEQLATTEAFERDPKLVWTWYEWRRDLIRHAKPNAAHYALARLEATNRNRFRLITQNVDGLHATAGSSNVSELHGNIFRVRCTKDGVVSERRERLGVLPPLCQCGALLRPDVVWFGEVLNESLLAEAATAVTESDLMLIIGTSGAVYPAAGLISLLQGTSIEINPEVTPLTNRCDFAIQQPATLAVRAVVEALAGGGR